MYFVRRVLRVYSGVPCLESRLARRVHRLQRSPDFVHLVVEQVADQQVGYLAAQMGILLDELAEAKAVVVFAHQSPHAIDSLVEQFAPTPELLGRRVAAGQSVGDRIGGEFARFEREQHARGIERV